MGLAINLLDKLRVHPPFTDVYELRGIEIGLINSASEVRGVQLGAINGSSGVEAGSGKPNFKTKGLQLGMWNETWDLTGLQAGVGNFAYYLRGAQVGLTNYAGGGKGAGGAQIGLANIVQDEFKGMQLGVLCYAEEGTYAQLGLLTIRGTGPKYLRYTPLFGFRTQKQAKK